jgi:nucleotide-binding universal stress UspA family protein
MGTRLTGHVDDPDAKRPRPESLPIVVGIDGSSSALEAARWAAREAARRRTTVQLISAFGWPETGHIGDPGLGGHYRETMMKSAERRSEPWQVRCRVGASARWVTGDEIDSADPALRTQVEAIVATGRPSPRWRCGPPG